MRFYIASKVNSHETLVRNLVQELEHRGHENLYDWTDVVVEKPFSEHSEKAHEVAEFMAKAIMNCDVLVLLTAPNGLGMHIETGGALVSGIISSFIKGEPNKSIYIVGDDNERSVFYFHESVIRLPDIQSLLVHIDEQYRPNEN